jgi:hypothetical protein
MKQSTTNNNKNENMKMRKTLITAVALAACVSTQLFAQNKEDVMTFSLTGQQQTSVSTSPTVVNAGNWTDGPKYYKTGTTKVTDKDIIKYIAFVLHNSATYYSSQAKLVLVQGELSGFFNITPDLGNSIVDPDMDGSFTSNDGDASTAIANSFDSAYVQLDNGQHLLVNTLDNTLYPIGHLQPWGQIYVKDTARNGYSVDSPLCENVTYFFAMTVEECYDCFYMNSFVSDASFTIKNGQQNGPPCCGTSSTMYGKGKDRYFLSLSFDNTVNNPYLNYYNSFCYVGVDGITGSIVGDGVVPDKINVNPYHDPIKFLVGKAWPYEARFTLEGIFTYTWNLQFVNSSDISPDFVGTGSFAASGYGFIGLFCELLTGSATFTEKIVKPTCCTGENWYDWWYGVGAEYEASGTAPDYATLYWDGVYPTPMNVSTSLSFHQNFDKSDYPWRSKYAPSGWFTEPPYPEYGIVIPLFWSPDPTL